MSLHCGSFTAAVGRKGSYKKGTVQLSQVKEAALELKEPSGFRWYKGVQRLSQFWGLHPFSGNTALSKIWTFLSFFFLTASKGARNIPAIVPVPTWDLKYKKKIKITKLKMKLDAADP